VDARAAGRFEGTAPEPWPVKHSGHMPGAKNVFFLDLIDETERTMKPASELRARFDAAGVDMTKPIIATCGSGVTACTVALALHLLGHKDVAVYDGSWAEWGNHDDAVVER
jgi:thiosulfate/3-mercaptopyruvate sulfurtransferase